MPGIVIVGVQWGDEGKGKATDLLGERNSLKLGDSRERVTLEMLSHPRPCLSFVKLLPASVKLTMISVIKISDVVGINLAAQQARR